MFFHLHSSPIILREQHKQYIQHRNHLSVFTCDFFYSDSLCISCVCNRSVSVYEGRQIITQTSWKDNDKQWAEPEAEKWGNIVIFHLKKYFCVLKTWFVCETQNSLDCILYPTTQCTQLHSFFHYEEWHGFIAGQPAWCHLILFWNRELSRWQDFSSLSSSLWCV